MPHTILYVTASPGNTFGGGKRVFFSLIRSLDKNEFTPVVACAQGKYSEMLMQAGVNVYNWDPTGPLAYRAAQSLSRIVEQIKPSFIHCQGGARADRIVTTITSSDKALPKISTVAVLPDNYRVCRLRRMLYKIIDRKSKRNFNHIITVSDTLRNILIKQYGLHETKVTTIRNGVDVSSISAHIDNTTSLTVRHELGIRSKTPLIGAFGRLVWEKGFDVLIKSMRSCKECRMILVGDGPEKKILQRITTNLHLQDRVIFTGFRNDVYRLLSAVDIVAIPSFVEGCPMITLEAMAMRKPIVASDIPAIAEQITHNKHAHLVPPHDSTALASAISRILTNYHEAEKLADTAQKHVEHAFSLKNMTDSTMLIYRKLIHEQ